MSGIDFFLPSVTAFPKPCPLHGGLIEPLASLGLTAPPSQLDEAMVQLPEGRAGMEESELILGSSSNPVTRKNAEKHIQTEVVVTISSE